MSLPVLEKTWQYNVNILSAVTGTDEGDVDSMILQIKNALLGFGLFPWQVVGSSNSLIFNMAGTDLLLTEGDIVHDFAAPHSWIVLKQPQISANASICIDLDHPTVNKLSLIFSPAAGFTGGSISARPTATDEKVMILRDFWIGTWPGTFGFPLRAHVWQSIDGQCTRLITAHSNAVKGFWLIDKPANPVSGWTNPAICAATPDLGAGLTLKYTNWFNTNPGMVRAEGPIGDMTLRLTSESQLTFPYPTVPQILIELTGEVGLTQIGVFHNVTVGQRGRHGRIFDMWCTSGIPITGDSFNGLGSHQFMIFDNFVLPWNGTNIVNG
jgi:hypothetical protein